MNIKDQGFSNRHLVVGEEGVKGKVLCMAFHMLMDWFHDNHWKKKGWEQKVLQERGWGSFRPCKNKSPEPPLWKVSDGHASKGFVLMVQSQYGINAEFYDSKFHPQRCFPFKRWWIRIWNQEDVSNHCSHWDLQQRLSRGHTRLSVPSIRHFGFELKGQGLLSLSTRRLLKLAD